MTIDIDKNDKFALLSNFSENHFEIDGIICYSMEGFLQSLKFEDPSNQIEVCKTFGKQAKFLGKKKKWWKTQTLFWKGSQVDRHSNEYQLLLDRAFQSLSKNQEFGKTLLLTEDNEIVHESGKDDPYRTILTKDEFIKRLYKIRKLLTLKSGLDN